MIREVGREIKVEGQFLRPEFLEKRENKLAVSRSQKIVGVLDTRRDTF